MSQENSANDNKQENPLKKPISRREMIKLATVTGVGAALGMTGMGMFTSAGTPAAPASSGRGIGNQYAFYGEHQAGIATTPQKHLVFAAFDVTSGSAKELIDLLRVWSLLSADMCSGKAGEAAGANPNLPPEDTGEAVGLSHSGLTITIGFGPSLFRKNGVDRFGIAGKTPAPLVTIPPMRGDSLDAERCDGDLCVQACADDAQVAFYAVRNLIRAARGVAVSRWIQHGFTSFPENGKGQKETTRNLFGFKDGTANLDTSNKDLMDNFVWVNESDGPAWMAGGSYLAARRIRMLIERWDRTSLDEQEKTFGRAKASGAPMGTANEFDRVDPDKLPQTSHTRLALGDGSIKILRRGYSYMDGMDPKTGQMDAGLFFISFQRDLQKQFIPLLARLSAHDKLNEYTKHVSSAVFACPPTARNGGYVGESLFG